MPKEFPGVQSFLFQGPLYETYLVSPDFSEIKTLLYYTFKADGYCPECARHSTFSSSGPMSADQWNYFQRTKAGFYTLDIKCARNEEHEIRFYVLAAAGVVQKVGQYPSFADIALDESKAYSQAIPKEDSSELHKAIGLAAHGVGIGSYVYIRRIFERLIQRRFDSFKVVEKWDDAEFQKMRMSERVELLRDHLPAFLVENRKIYSILSLGIHELDEDDCLGFFEILRTSTVVILEEDKKKKEELALKANLEKSILAFDKKASARKPQP